MASIDRGMDLSGWSDDLRGALRRRLSEGGGIALIVLAAMIAVVARRPGRCRTLAQPRHRRAGAQPARHARRGRRRPADATVRARFDRVPAAARGLGLAHRQPSAARPRMDAARVLACRLAVRRRIGVLPAEERPLAAADRARRRHRRRRAAAAGAGARPAQRDGVSGRRRDLRRADAGDGDRCSRLRLPRSVAGYARRALGARGGGAAGRRRGAGFGFARLAGPCCAQP